ncbi:endonuclease/exonuclease/phosphatase family protein [Empedobacter stercoris]|uniref:endonuclease/exonuclease/phosphatase family protein n=1 Tax=Empedobacter stercoris TaxID=1628248 RepID=UPI001CE1EAB1|nr:endonuclease/exonuclease/phosphatase family protein [Empedobacter stercoris]MCA4781130.1 endonuclease/exonuclease/phosphatase family protein [Empedobacter stercoris]
MLTKWSRILFFVFVGIYLTSKSFYQYFVFDMLAQYSIYALIIAFFLCLIYNYSIRKQEKKNILWLIPLVAIPIITYKNLGNFYFGENAKGEKSNFKITSINIFSQNEDFHYLKNYLEKEKSDVLILQELTPAWQKNVEFIRQEYPFYKEEVRNNNFGIAIYSKVPLTKVSTKNYIDEMHPSILAEISVNGKPVSILATHPVPPLPNQARFEKRNQQYELMKHEIDALSTENIILIGDLNCTVYSPNFKLVQSDKLKDARSGFGLQNSWNAFIPIFRTNIDQCWVTKSMKVTNFYRGEDIKSDHFPIVAELKIE